MSLFLSPSSWLAFGVPGTTELIIILAIGLLIFGRRLPEVGRSVGKSIVEFKKGVKGIGDEIETESGSAATSPKLSDQSVGRGDVRDATDSMRASSEDVSSDKDKPASD